MKNSFYFFLLIIVSVLFSSVLHAQRSTLVGLAFTAETSGNHFRPGFGATIEHKFTRKSGIESGLYYRNYSQNNTYMFANSSGTGLVPYTLMIVEKFISVPVLYKFYSRLVNVSAGMSFDFYVGFRHKNKSQQLTVNDYSIDPNMAVGVQVKMSKPIRLDEKLILEPELRLNPVITYNRSYAGIGITAKYRLK